ncbi:MAG: TIGR04283 family arsenosugar biosynthesis glycosyltransferase [Thermodesulfovibrionales bacterium]
MTISVIIPTYNEAERIRDCIQSVKGLSPSEIIVVDGGSTDETIDIAKQEGAIIIHSTKGRGIQLNKGASFAKGDILMFIHADSKILTEDYNQIAMLYKMIKDIKDNTHSAGGFFRLKFDSKGLSVRLVELFANIRAEFFSLPYGDQAIFIKREFFNSIGGFRDYPFLEDIDLVMRLRKIKRLRALPFWVLASSRRIDKGYPLSPVLVSLRNVVIATLFILGVSPYKLQSLYK